MARPLRVRVAGGWYHVTGRGRDRGRLFGDGADRERYGDWGRDLALWAGRQYGGLTLRELGVEAGGADYTGVAMAIRRLAYRARRDRPLRLAMQRVAKECAK